MLKIYNSLNRRKEKFVPIDGKKVGIYVCGITVYDYCHLGHARTIVAFDAIIRYLRHLGYQVTYVRNITDIDDKIIRRANELGESVESLTHRFIQYMQEDFACLGAVAPDHEPRATEYIPQIIDLIRELVQNGHAYPALNHDVYYRVRSFARYGQLSGRNLDELQSGARIEPDEAKDDPLDFVLWKHAKPGEPSWDSPWGPGRPGWHIECSAMSGCLLGDHFDIHGGGVDLLFPHHENEIAQSQAATGCCFVNFWVHNGHLNIDAEKMSKSLNNFLTIREVLERAPNPAKVGEILRVAFLSSHYRSPLNYSEEAYHNASAALERVYQALERSEKLTDGNSAECESGYVGKFEDAMNDDFNTPDALSVLFECIRELNRSVEKGTSERGQVLRNSVLLMTSTLGIGELSTENYFRSAGSGADAEIVRLVEKRQQARQEKQWQLADEIRAELDSLGIAVKDSSDGASTWRRI